MQHPVVQRAGMTPAVVTSAVEDVDILLVRLIGTIDGEGARRLRIAVKG